MSANTFKFQPFIGRIHSAYHTHILEMYSAIKPFIQCLPAYMFVYFGLMTSHDADRLHTNDDAHAPCQGPTEHPEVSGS